MKLITADIYEGAYLLSQGMELETLWLNGKNGKNGKRSVVFQFTGSEAALLRKDYQRGQANANVTKLKQSLTELKDRMFNLLRTAPNLQAATGQVETERRPNHEWRQYAVK